MAKCFLLSTFCFLLLRTQVDFLATFFFLKSRKLLNYFYFLEHRILGKYTSTFWKVTKSYTFWQRCPGSGLLFPALSHIRHRQRRKCCDLHTILIAVDWKPARCRSCPTSGPQVGRDRVLDCILVQLRSVRLAFTLPPWRGNIFVSYRLVKFPLNTFL